MPYCDQCSKMRGYELGDPEVDLDIELGDNGEGVIIGTVRIVLQCSDCANELKESTFDINTENTPLDLSTHVMDKDNEHPTHNLELSHDIEISSRSEGKGRGTKTFYGFEGEVVINCSCNSEFSDYIVIKDEIQASQMDLMR